MQILDNVLQSVLRQYQLPGLAGILYTSEDGIIATGAAGLREIGTVESITIEDKFHIGSCTKAMTATLAALFVERGLLSWDTRVLDVFAEYKNVAHSGFATVTLRHLLTHTAGITSSMKDKQEFWDRMRKWQDSLRAARTYAVGELLSWPLIAVVGERFLYSNAGYVIIGAILEKITDIPFEELMDQELFTQLGMHTAGFGAPAKQNSHDQPWGHVKQGARTVSIAPAGTSDNPGFMSPAGRVHCSLSDWAKFAKSHMVETPGNQPLLRQDTLAKMHSPPKGNFYSFGWCVGNDAEFGKILSHFGSNTMFTAAIWIAPSARFACLTATNIGGEEARDGCQKVIDACRNFLRDELPS